MRHTTVPSALISAPYTRYFWALAAFFGLWLTASPKANAQCSAGSAVGVCTQNSQNYAGCCTGQKVQWCESTTLCEINCASQANYACCSAHGGIGCCDQQIQQCVCNRDSYCCGQDFWLGGEWDADCVTIARTECGGCGNCSTQCGWDSSNSIYDCATSASASPNAAFPRDCGGSTGGCTPNCTGKTCGPDGCGGICGSCLSTETCSAAGRCESNSGCTPNCTDKNCGSDGCGGVCGSCISTEECSAAGRCQPIGGGSDAGNGNDTDVGSDTTCQPDCSGKSCGPDGCGGYCGSCAAGKECNSAGQCVEPACSCAGKECGDNGCGRICGYCTTGMVCNESTNKCEEGGSTPGQDTSDASDGAGEGDVNSGGEDVGGSDVSGPSSCPEGFLWSAFQQSCVPDPNWVPPSTGGSSEDKSSGCYGADATPWALGLMTAYWMRRRRTT